MSTCSCEGGICQGLCSKTFSVWGFPRNADKIVLTWRVKITLIPPQFLAFAELLTDNSVFTQKKRKLHTDSLALSGRTCVGHVPVGNFMCWYTKHRDAFYSASGGNVAVLVLKWCVRHLQDYNLLLCSNQELGCLPLERTDCTNRDTAYCCPDVPLLWMS